MPLRRMSELLANVSQLLVRAGKRGGGAERADAIKQLKVIRDNLDAEARSLEAEIKNRQNRNVELASTRGASNASESSNGPK
jgi:hypothetical protein